MAVAIPLATVYTTTALMFLKSIYGTVLTPKVLEIKGEKLFNEEKKK